jgi:hypothetical protein
MRVIKFFTKRIDDDKIEPYIWYIEDKLKPSQIVNKIEEFLRRNQLICYLSSFALFDSAKEYENTIKKEIEQFKNRYTL